MARTLIRGNTQIMDLTITNAQIDATAGIELSKILDGDKVVLADATTGAVNDLNMGGNNITNLAAGVNPGDAVNKAQLDAVSAGLDPKQSVRLATTTNIDLTSGGLLIIDGVQSAVDDRILVKDQTNAVENGIYVVVNGTWTRATDFDGTPANEVSGGAFTFVEQGSQSGSGWVVVHDGNVVVDTDPINWTLFSAAGAYTGGTAIDITGGVISVKYDNSTISVTGDQLYVPAGGITATEIAADTITSAEIAADAITSSELAANAVDSVHIVAGAVDGTHIADASIDSNHIVAGAVDGTHIAANTITAANIAADTITAAEIAADAITGSELAANAVDSVHITAGAIDSTHLSADFLDGIGPGLAGNGLSYDTTTDTLNVNVDGSTIEITTDSLNVVAGGIGTTQLADLAVTTAKIADLAVTTGKIADLAVTTAKIADLAVTTAKIADANVTFAKLDSGMFGAGLSTDSTSVFVDTSVVSTFAGWTKYSWPAEAIATNTLVYTFNGGNPIVANTFELYLNGILLEPGAGNDYTINLTTGVVTFASAGDAPRTNDKLYAHFVDVP